MPQNTHNATPSFLRQVWRLAAPYWSSEEKWSARLLLAVIVSMNLGIVYINVLINAWNNDFYNALQTVNKTAFFHALGRFAWLAAIYIVLAVYQTYLNQMLQIRWRRWMTHHYLDRWLRHQTYYRMQLLGQTTDNPDQRISEDIDGFTDRTLSISLGLLNSIVTLGSFILILWKLSGPLSVGLGRYGHLVIPGYMVWVAIAYAVVGSWLTIRIGRPLVGLNFTQQRYEADFRYSLVRLRENSEGVALYGGEAQETVHFHQRIEAVVSNYWQIMKQQKKVTWLTSGYNQVAIVFPLLVGAPRFFAGTIKLGGLMQISSAFNQVQGALSYLVESYNDLARWKAVADRLSGFVETLGRMDALKAQDRIERSHGNEAAPRITDLTVRLPNSGVLLENLNLHLKAGDWLLVSGPSGAGKSTLLRALAGIWPFGDGRVQLPAMERILFLPQKPYLPQGTLRQVLCYPEPPATGTDAVMSSGQITAVMQACGLEYLIPRLDETDLWSQRLSLGEQQRIGFVRAILQAPTLLFLDEATASLDEHAEAALHQQLKQALPDSIVVSVGHRSTLLAWHNLRLKFGQAGGWQMETLSLDGWGSLPARANAN